ncbi:MAG: hypothetical protein AB7O66_13310 [Limisphaerales bacterium]
MKRLEQVSGVTKGRSPLARMESAAVWVTLFWLGGGFAWSQPRVAQVISAPDPSSSAGARVTGNGEADSPSFSRDGRFIVFSSSASDLTPQDVNGFRRDVFVREVATGQTRLVSVNPAGVSGNGDSFAPDISGDGRYVAFLSRASDLVEADTNQVADVFVRDMIEGRTIRASVAPDGRGADAECQAPRITPDGKTVVFGSRATNLEAAAPDTDGRVDVFVSNLASGVTTLVSNEARDGTAHDVDDYAVSDDGRWVAFRTISTNVVAGVLGGAPSGVHVRDTERGVTTRLEMNLLSVVIGTRTTVEARSLAFAPGRPRLAVGTWVVGTVGPANVTNIVEVLELGESGARFLGGSAGAHGTLLDEPTALSFDPTGDVLGFSQTVQSGQPAMLRLWRELDGVITVTNAATGQPIQAREVAVGPQGTRVAFTSSATNLVQGGTPPGEFQLYLVAPATGRVDVITTNGIGSAAGGMEFGRPSFGPDGRLTFQCSSGELVARDGNGATDVFESDPGSASLSVLSTRSGPAAKVASGRSTLSPGGVSADGRRVLFASTADDLVANDAKQRPDLFVRDLDSGRTILVTVPGVEGGPSRPGFGEAALSENGRFVAFTADWILQLEDGSRLWTPQVFVRDLSLGFTRVVALNPDGRPARMRTVSQLRISADGRYIAFYTDAASLVDGPATRGLVVLRDLAANRNFLVDTVDSGRVTVALAGLGGRTLATRSGLAPLRGVLLDPMSGVPEEFSAPSGSTASLTYDGRRVVFAEPGDGAGSPPRVRWRDEGDPTFQEAALPNDAAAHIAIEAISRNGRWVALREGAGPSGLTDRATWVMDLDTGVAARLEVSPDGSFAKSLSSPFPSFSADGRFLAFRSASKDLVADDPNSAGDIFVRDLVGIHTTRVARVRDGTDETDGVGLAILSADGRRLIFASWSDGFVRDDDNASSDVFFVDWAGSPFRDLDGDEMDDGWELSWFGNLLRTGDQDLDQDGLTDRDEFRSGSCPLDDRSGARLHLVANRIGAGALGLSWSTESGRQYQVQASITATGSNWTQVGAPYIGDGQPVQITLSIPDDGARFFRVAAE